MNRKIIHKFRNNFTDSADVRMPIENLIDLCGDALCDIDSFFDIDYVAR